MSWVMGPWCTEVPKRMSLMGHTVQGVGRGVEAGGAEVGVAVAWSDSVQVGWPLIL